MGVLKGWEAGEMGGITQHCLKFAIAKWLNEGGHEKRGGKNEKLIY